jgi:hypothetical protein
LPHFFLPLNTLWLHRFIVSLPLKALSLYHHDFSPAFNASLALLKKSPLNAFSESLF